MVSATRAAKVLFGLGIAAALGMGATDVRATPAAAGACTVDYSVGLIGACQSTTHCQSGCAWFYPENGGTGFCRNGCCTCAY